MVPTAVMILASEQTQEETANSTRFHGPAIHIQLSQSHILPVYGFMYLTPTQPLDGSSSKNCTWMRAVLPLPLTNFPSVG